MVVRKTTKMSNVLIILAADIHSRSL